MKNTLFVLCFCFLAYGTSNSQEGSTGNAQPVPHIAKKFAQPDPIIGLASPIQLERGVNVIEMEDYFLDVGVIKGASAQAAIMMLLSPDNKTLTVHSKSSMPTLVEVTIATTEGACKILMKAPMKKPYSLQLKDAGYQTVQVKGEMNSWNPNLSDFKLKGDTWEWDFSLNAGFYQYIFVVDGKEMLDPNNPEQRPNGQGGFNSLINIPKPDPAKVPQLWTNRIEGDEVAIGFNNKPSNVIAFWENQGATTEIQDDQILLKIPAIAKTKKRSFLRVFSYNEIGLSNDILIPLEMGLPVQQPSQLERSDKEAQIMYFTLVDRFNNGNKANDAPVNDDRIAAKANYMGGDLDGITAKIKDGYFKSLNINSIWLSPITQNPETAFQEFPKPNYFYTGYHGYWPISSSKVDHRFGDDEAMRNLVEAAHENGINVLLDYVCNHVHEDHPIYKNHPEWATTLDLPDGRKNIRIWDEERLTTWFDTFIPTLDLSNPAVIDMQVDSTMYWLKKFQLDGYRHDATKHVPQAFWKELTKRLKEQVISKEGRSLYQIGETYGSRELIQSYIGSGMLDSQFDFNLYFDAREVFAKQETSMDILYNSMMETFNYYGHHNTMGYITGNHDQPRFITYASGAIDWAEDAKMAGFERDIQIKDPIGYDRFQMLLAYVMTIPGVPVIFYGDEIGMVGAGDPDNRRMMTFEGWNEKEAGHKKILEKLTNLRKNHLSLTYGDTEVLNKSETTFAYSRRYFSDQAMVFFNKSKESKTIKIDLPSGFESSSFQSNFNAKMTVKNGKAEITLRPWSFEILTNN